MPKPPRKPTRPTDTAIQPAFDSGLNPRDLQEAMDDSVVPEVLGRGVVLLGKKLRPVTLASIALLKQVKSDLIAGVVIEESDNIILDCCVFLLLHSVTLEEATELAFDSPNKLRMEALILADSIGPADVNAMTKAIVDLLRDSTSTQVKAEPKKDIKGGNPLGNS